MPDSKPPQNTEPDTDDLPPPPMRKLEAPTTEPVEDTVPVVVVDETPPPEPFEIEAPTGDAHFPQVRIRGSRLRGTPKKGLVQAICKARLAMEQVERSGYNKFLDHDYSNYDDVARAISEALAENGVWAMPSIVDTFQWDAGRSSSNKPQVRMAMVMEFTWTDGESSVVQTVVGESTDTSDKNSYKLQTQIERYALAKFLKLDTGDAEVDSPDHPSHSGKGGAAKPRAKKKEPPKHEYRFDPNEELTDAQRNSLKERGWKEDEDGDWYGLFTKAQGAEEVESLMSFGVVERRGGGD